MNNIHSKLDVRIQKWIYKQGWKDLYEIQHKAVQPILSCNRDVLISASTAGGKTEAFFLPACSATADQKQGFGILYISPLKALINDQYRRLRSLCEILDMHVTPWHGDVLQSKKIKTAKDPNGILLITPESLESLLIRKSNWTRHSFSKLKYICIDEFHAFIGTERGQHMLSLLNRLEHLLGRISNPIPRVALSATLGELEKVPQSLRPNGSIPCEIITSGTRQSTLKVQIKGYINPADIMKDKSLITAENQVCQEIYEYCRGNSNLVFANSRQRTESIAAKLADISAKNFVPNEFFPHHGSLSKELREELEGRLQKESIPTTAICTMTLELGIDIGKVNSVIQVTAPHSVSSLRQRLGRSGRRDSPSILKMLISENELIPKSSIVDRLRIQLIQSMAMIRLLVMKNWFEPADTGKIHYSAFLHQILATVAQWGSIRIEQLYSLLVEQGPFRSVTIKNFKILLSNMGATQLLQQLNSGELVLGIEGERLTNAYTFYAVFKTPVEYRVIAGKKVLGSIPVDSLVMEGQHIIFGGRRWKVTEIDDEKKTIYVTATKGGNPPMFGGNGMAIHDVVRQEMLKIYRLEDYYIPVDGKKIEFADRIAQKLFEEGTDCFKHSGLAESPFLQSGQNCYMFPWMGDKTVNALAMVLMQHGLKASSFAGVVEIRNTTAKEVSDCLNNIANNEFPSETELASILSESRKQTEKYDEYIPEPLLSESYGKKAFDSHTAKRWILETLEN